MRQPPDQVGHLQCAAIEVASGLDVEDSHGKGSAGDISTMLTLRSASGDRTGSLLLPRQALEKGWIRHWHLERDPNMTTLVDHPEIRSLLGEMRVRISEMREDLDKQPGESLIGESNRL